MSQPPLPFAPQQGFAPASLHRQVCVIGAGLGGMALAIRLQAAGIATTLIEARERAGGCLGVVQRDGYSFDTGPMAICCPGVFRALWALAGRELDEDVELLPVAPLWRVHWPDGASFDLAADEAQLRAEIARLAPGDVGGYEEFAEYAAEALAEGMSEAGQRPLLTGGDMLRLSPRLLKLQAWRSLADRVDGFVKAPRLRQVLSFLPLVTGGNPLTVPAPNALSWRLEREAGAWWPRGGMHRLADAMLALFQGMGGTVRLGDPVERIHTIGNRAHEVESHSGWRQRFDAVASNADLVHTYRHLLGENWRGEEMAGKLRRKRWTPGMFTVHFAAEGSWPGMPHRMVLMGGRWEEWLADVFEHGVLPRDGAIFLSHPTVTDPELAGGRSIFQASMPVANLAKLPIDWTEVGPMLEKRVLDEIGLRFIPDIHDRIVTRFHRTPADHAADLSAWAGSFASLEPARTQQGCWRARARDAVIGNLYSVGAAVHPGAGVSGVMAGARGVAALIVEDLGK